MKTMSFGFFVTLLSCLSLTLNADITDKATGVTFPSSVTFDYSGKSYDLDVTGVATRKKLIIKVYSIAHYLQKGVKGDPLQEIMSDKNAKQFTIKWVYATTKDKIRGAYEESLQKVFSQEQYSKLQPEIQKFLQYFNQDSKKGDEYILRWIPGGHLEVVLNGNKAGAIDNADFVKGIWNIWLGQNSVVDRSQLLSLVRA